MRNCASGNLEILRCAIAHRSSMLAHRPGMTNRKKPAVIRDGRLFFGVQKFLRPLRHATLTELFWSEEALGTPLADDLGGHPADSGAGEPDGAGGAGGQVENPAADEWAAVIDGHDHTAVAMGHPQLGAEWQRAVGAGHGALVEALARGGLAAGFVAVIGGHARETASGAGRRGDRRVGVAPGGPGSGPRGIAGDVVMAIAVMVVAVGFGRGLSGAATD